MRAGPVRMRSGSLLIGLLSAACVEAACPAPDAETSTDAGDAAVECTSRLVIGPIDVDERTIGLPGQGASCADYDAIELRVRVFTTGAEPQLVADHTATCGASLGSAYIDAGSLPPGRYQLAVETVDARLVVGADLVRSAPCEDPVDGRPSYCDPLTFELLACDLRIVPASLQCDDTTGAACALAP